MSGLNILFISPYTPTPIRARPYHLIKFLHRHHHQVTLATVWEVEQERVALQDLQALGIRVEAARLTKRQILANLARALASGLPLQALYSWHPELQTKIKELLSLEEKPWDIIHIEHLRGAWYGVSLQKQFPHINSIPSIVWDSVDNISLLFEQASKTSRSGFGRWVTRFELPRTRRYERDLACRFDKTLMTSPMDRQAFQRLGAEPAEMAVLPNGVDLDYFMPAALPRNPRQIVFSGKLSYHANLTAALYLVQEIMPFVWQRLPETEVILVGKDPPAELIRLSREDSRVRVTGYVPDIRPYLQQATLAMAAVPYGAGIQNKVLEAMACATPVVANPQAISAISPLPGKDLLVEETPEGLAAAALCLLNDPDLAVEIGKQGRLYVSANHDWNNIVDQLELLYRDVSPLTHND
jgi:glycosyltransferase involved in cell wall biosynthesis